MASPQDISPVNSDEFPIPAKMAHMVLFSSNVEAMADWYRQVLGCKTVHEWTEPRRAIFMSYDEEHHRVAVMEPAGGVVPAPRNAAGLAHVAYSYAGFDNLLTTYERLIGLGIEPARCINHRLSTSFYYQDPDGNGVELFTDNPGTPEDLKAAFDLPTVVFDPADLLIRWRAGASAEEMALAGVR